MQLLVEQQYTGKTISIFSDSQAALKALEATKSTSRTILHCKKLLNILGDGNKVSLIWIPGHVGLEGNERADSLAKIGAGSPFVGPEPTLSVPKNLARDRLCEWVRGATFRDWNDSPGMEHAKKILAGPSKHRTGELLKAGRNGARTLTAVYTGHCRLRSHLQRMGLVEDAECRLCMEDDETMKHVMCTCPAGGRTRFEMFGKPMLDLSDLGDISPSDITAYIKRLGLEGEL